MADPQYKLLDLVETAKGAPFWGQIIAFDNDLKMPGCTVRAIASGFEGIKHVYPLKQLRHVNVDELINGPARDAILEARKAEVVRAAQAYIAQVVVHGINQAAGEGVELRKAVEAYEQVA